MTCHVTVFIVCHSLLLGKFHNYTGVLNFNFSHAQQNPCMYMCVYESIKMLPGVSRRVYHAQYMQSN